MKETHFNRSREDSSRYKTNCKWQAPPSGPEANRYHCLHSEGLSNELVGTE